jgi:hypothetical protein
MSSTTSAPTKPLAIYYDKDIDRSPLAQQKHCDGGLWQPGVWPGLQPKRQRCDG